MRSCVVAALYRRRGDRLGHDTTRCFDRLETMPGSIRFVIGGNVDGTSFRLTALRGPSVEASKPMPARWRGVGTGAFTLSCRRGTVGTGSGASTTHWRFAGSRLQREYPSLRVESYHAFSDHDGNVWTARPITAGIDLALALIEEDHDFFFLVAKGFSVSTSSVLPPSSPWRPLGSSGTGLLRRHPRMTVLIAAAAWLCP